MQVTARRGRRGLVVLAAAALLAGGTALVPPAGPPGRAQALADPDGSPRIFVPAEPVTYGPQVCGFPVHVAPVANREYIVQQSTQPDGTVVQRITGHIDLTVTNLTTGAAVTLNASGPSTTTTAPDGSGTFAGQGHTFVSFGPRTQARFHVPGILLNAGPLFERWDATGRLTEFSTSGHQTDVCALLR